MNVRLLKGKMVEAGYTQRTLAEEMGISPQSLSRKMNQKRQFTLGEVLDICNLLGMSCEQKISIFLPEKSQKCNEERSSK